MHILEYVHKGLDPENPGVSSVRFYAYNLVQWQRIFRPLGVTFQREGDKHASVYE